MMPRSRAVAFACGAAAVALTLTLAIRPTESAPSDFVPFLGRFHTLALHLPIGVLVLALVFEVLALWPKVRPRVDPAIGIALPFFLATATVAFALGLLLARGGGYPAQLVSMHRAFTLSAIVASAGATIAWSARKRPAYRAQLAATVLLLTVGAHFGGSMTHGDQYLVRYAPAFVKRIAGVEQVAKEASREPAAPSAEPLVFADVVLPMLRERCVACHGAERAQGKLRLDSFEAIAKGGENGPVVVVGRGGASPLVARMTLPEASDDRMPPSGKPGLRPDEIQLIRWWIDRGATETLRVRDAIVPDAARNVLARAVDRPAEEGSETSHAPATEPTPAAPAITPPRPEAVPDGARNAANRGVLPLLASRCGKCHGAEKQKGRLRVDSMDALVAGGNSGAAIVLGDPSAGTLLARIRLPLDNDKHMPPRDEPQLSRAEVGGLASWIARGAKGTAPPRTKTAADHEAARDPGPIAATPWTGGAAAILARRCGECHSGASAMAGMRVDDRASLIGRKQVVPGRPDASPLYARLVLLPSDSDHMPPTDRPQPTVAELAAIRAWIENGANDEAGVSAKGASDVPADAAPVATSDARGAPPAIAGHAGGCASCAVVAPHDRPSASLPIALALIAVGAFGARRCCGSRGRLALARPAKNAIAAHAAAAGAGNPRTLVSAWRRARPSSSGTGRARRDARGERSP